MLADLHAGEQLVEVRGDHLLERDEPLAVGQHDEAGQQRRHLDPREAPLAGVGVAHSTARFSDRFEMYGNGCAGSTASGVSTGKIRSLKTSVSHSRCSSSSSAQADEADALLLEPGDEHVGEEVDAPAAIRARPAPGSPASCSAGVSPSGVAWWMPAAPAP